MGQFGKATVDISYDVVTHSVFTIRDLLRQFKNRGLTNATCGAPQGAILGSAVFDPEDQTRRELTVEARPWATSL